METEPQEQEQEVIDHEPQEVFESEGEPEQVEDQGENEAEATQVPLSALQKERVRRKEEKEGRLRAEIENQYLKEQFQKKEEPPEEDDSIYESVTKKELSNSNQSTKAEIMREVEEKIWRKSFAERASYVDENLEQFLAKRPNLASAINDSTNRYEEAYELMSALSDKGRKELSKPQKKASPGSPSTMPKAASLNAAVDVMSMNDDEYRTWRQSKKRR